MIYVMYLAAGSSRRFGEENKLFYKINGKRLFEFGLEILENVKNSRNDVSINVVTKYEEVAEYAKEKNFNVIISENSEKGISYTIKSGIKGIEKFNKKDYFMFMVSDQPFITYETINKLLNCAKDNIKTACVSSEGEFGNPTLFSSSIINELLTLEGDVGGKSILRKYNCKKIVVDKKELEDIDKPL